MTKKTGSKELERVPRIPPYSEDSERGVLGAALLDNRFLRKCVKQNLTPDHFYVLRHKTVYESMLKVMHKKKPVDLITVTEQMQSDGSLTMIGGINELHKLVDATPTAVHGPHYLDTVLQKAKGRELIETCGNMIETVFANNHSVEDLVSQAKFAFHKIGFLPTNEKSVREIVAGLIQGYRGAEKTGSIGIPSRWYDYQKRIIGYMAGKPSIVAAGAGQGKTTMAINEGLHKAMIGEPVLIISIEMQKEEIIERAIGDLMGLDITLFKRGLATSNQIQQFFLGGQVIEQIPFYVEHGNFTAEQIAALIREYAEEKGVTFVVIDYMQLVLPTPGAKFANRNVELTHISQTMVHVANDTKVHIMELSQLSRGYKLDKNAEPELHHLRDSGSLEQDAYMVTFVFRDPDCDEDWTDDQPTVFKVAKHRGAAMSRTYMTFQKTKQRFVGKDNFTLEPKLIEKPKELTAHEVNNSENEVPF